MKIIHFVFLLGLAVNAPAQTPRLVVPVGHTGNVFFVDFSPDGKSVLTCSADHTLKRWDLSGREIETSYNQDSCSTAVAISPDGKYILKGGGREPDKMNQTTRFGIATLIDRASGREIRTYTGHAAPVHTVAFSKDGQYILTGSADETVKLYNLETGQEVRTFKGKAGFGSVLAAVLSPDGKQVLAGSPNMVECWDLQSARPIRSLQLPPDERVFSMTFSPQGETGSGYGRYILIGGERGAKLIDWSGKIIYTYTGHSSAVYTLAFYAGDGGKSLLMGCADGSAKRWNLAETGIQALAGPGEAVVAVAFSADGSIVLTGATDNTIKQWNKNGRTIITFNGTVENPTAIAFSPPTLNDPTGGKFIGYGTRENTVEVWNRQTRKKIRVITRPVDAGRMFEARADWEQFVSALAFSPADGGKSILLGDADGNVEIWDKDTGEKKIAIKGGSETDLYREYYDSDAAKTMSFKEYIAGLGHSGRIYAVAFSPACPDDSAGGKFFLSGSADNTAKLWDTQGKLLHAFNHNHAVLAVAFSADGRFLLTGCQDDTTRLWDRASGKLLQTFAGHTANTLAFSPDGRFVLTGSPDNTSKLWDTQNGRQLATLIAVDSDDWVITTSSGLFDASPGAMRLMHFVQGREIIGLEQLKGRYWEPGLLPVIMGFAKGELRDVSGFGTLPLYPEIKAAITGDRLHVDLVERSGGMGRLSLFVNGKEKMPDANPDKKTGLDIDLSQFALDLLPDSNTISLRSYIAGDGWLKSQDYNLPYSPAGASGGKGDGDSSPGPKPVRSPRPQFYAILVGTSQYVSPDLKLNFPDGDARAMEKALEAVSSAWLGADRVHIRHLTTDAKNPADLANKANIEAAFSDFAAQAKSTDILVVFFSGHGKTYTANGKSNFYYLTKDMRSMEELDDAGIREKFAISDEELGQWLIDNHALRQVLIFDACNSGAVVQNFSVTGARDLNASQIRANDLLKDRTGTFILAGAAADKVSFEASKYGQGLLTRSLLEGMSGLALDEDRVDVTKLFEYACRKVPELAADVDQVQKPVPYFPKGGSFPIGIKDDKVKIDLPPGKPVMIRNNFQDNRFGDQLGLNKALDQYYRDLTVRPAEAQVSYVPVDEYNEEAYSIRGRYTVTDDAVVVEERLFKGQTPLGNANFRVNGRKNDVPGLVKAIVEAVWKMVR